MFPTETGVVRRATHVTSPPLQLLAEGIRDIVSRRRLIRYLVQAEMKKRGSDTLLGNLWWILDPLLQMLVYLVFITIISRRSQPDYPLFIFSAILPYKWFTSVVNGATTSVVKQDKLIRQIAFPKLILPVATGTAEVVGFAWGMIPLFAIMLFYASRISPFLLWIPVIAAVQYVFSLAAAVFVAAANVFRRDFEEPVVITSGNDIGEGALEVGQAAQRIQTGLLRTYVLAFGVGTAVIAVILLVVR